jgi:hypothetical protein
MLDTRAGFCSKGAEAQRLQKRAGCFFEETTQAKKGLSDMEQSDSVAHSVAAGLGVLTIGLVVFAIMLVPAIFYLLTLQKALNRCSSENRAMNPGMVWLMFIPLFNLVWHFMIVLNMAKSLGAEFQKRGMAEDPQPGKSLGMVLCIVGCCCLIPLLNFLAGPAYLVCWILYWVKIAGYSAKIAAPPVPAAA